MLMAQLRPSTINTETDFNRVSKLDQAWSTVWQRRKLSKKKLRQFFGKSAPVDVTLTDIEKYGLPALLQSNVPLCYFLYSLLEQYSSENLFFYLEVEQFQAHEFNTKEELRKTALQLYRAFIKSNSDFEINIDASTRRPIRLAIDRFEHDCFDSAKNHVQRLLEPCYLHFINSNIYKCMVKDLQGQFVPYNAETREKAINILVEYLDTHIPIDDAQQPLKPGPAGEIQRRNNLSRAMIHAFCQTRLHLDFYDSPNGENVKLTPEQMLPPKESSSSTEKRPQTGDLSKLIQLNT